MPVAQVVEFEQDRLELIFVAEVRKLPRNVLDLSQLLLKRCLHRIGVSGFETSGQDLAAGHPKFRDRSFNVALAHLQVGNILEKLLRIGQASGIFAQRPSPVFKFPCGPSNALDTNVACTELPSKKKAARGRRLLFR
jgi:hypothetical protein